MQYADRYEDCESKFILIKIVDSLVQSAHQDIKQEKSQNEHKEVKNEPKVLTNITNTYQQQIQSSRNHGPRILSSKATSKNLSS